MMPSINEYNDMLCTVEQVHQVLTKALGHFDCALKQVKKPYLQTEPSTTSVYVHQPRGVTTCNASKIETLAVQAMQEIFELLSTNLLLCQQYQNEVSGIIKCIILDIHRITIGTLLHVKNNIGVLKNLIQTDMDLHKE